MFFCILYCQIWWQFRLVTTNAGFRCKIHENLSIHLEQIWFIYGEGIDGMWLVPADRRACYASHHAYGA